jgi:endonuclease V-like protein UPF0215 family
LTRRFAIKKEIRSLGIDLCNPGRVIGAVVRGGLYLDGVVVFSPKPTQWTASIANEVVRTRFYPELKLIITHDPEQKLDIRRIERMTSLPVLEVRARTRGRLNGFRRFWVAKKELQVVSSLETRIVQQILEGTWTTGSLPESLRVAHLIAKSRFLERNRPFRANK